MAKAYLNALAEEGTRSDLVKLLVRLDAEIDELKEEVDKLNAELKDKDALIKAFMWKRID